MSGVVRSSKLSHGTLESIDLHATRRFYEEVLGLHVCQFVPVSIHLDLGDGYMYAAVHAPNAKRDMPRHFRNTLLFDSAEAIDDAHRVLTAVRDEYSIMEITEPVRTGDRYGLLLRDLDGNWWELVHDDRNGYHEIFPREAS